MKKQLIYLLAAFISLSSQSAFAQFTLATDNAGNYSGTWGNGNNYGSGFNAWSISYGSNTGTFIGNPSNDGMGTTGIGTTAFGLYATGTGYVNANRQMTTALELNDKFSFYWAMNWDANGGNKGFDIKASGSTVFNVNNNNSATITCSSGTIDGSYGTNPMFVEITRTGSNSYSFSMTKRSDGTTYTTTFTSTNPVNELGIYIGNQNDGSGQRNIYFNHFNVTNDGNFNTGSDDYVYSKVLTGSGSLTKSGTGQLTLTGQNTYSGTTTVNGGILKLDCSSGNTLSSSTNVTINSGGTLAIYKTQTLESLTVNSGGNLIVTAGADLTVTGSLVINEDVTIDDNLFMNDGSTLTVASGKTLTIDGGLYINTDATIDGNLTITSNGTVSVYAGKSLTVNGTLTNNGSLNLLSDNSGTGSLIHTNSGVNATVERYILSHNNVPDEGWHLLGSPVASFNVSGSSFNPGTNDDLYAWSESSKLWLNYKAGEFTQIEPGKGYLVAYENTTTKSFSGTLNVSDITFSNLSYTTSQGNGWHLLGNPFASALIWNNGSWSLSNVNGTAKIWHSTNKSYSDISANGIIPQAQGFFVRVTNASNSLTIPVSARTHSSQAWYKNSDVPQLKLIARPSDGSSAQETIIRVEPEATIGEDPYWDSQFLAGYAPQLYSLVDGVKLSTNALPSISEATEILLGFNKNQHNNFTIELSDNSLANTVLLKDLKTGITQNLSQQPVYSFTADDGDDPLRFKLAFSSVGIAPAPQNTAPYVWYASQALHVSNITPNLVMEVYSSNGQSLIKQKVSTSKIPFHVTPGVYMIKLTGDTFSSTQKIVVY
jgi:autotransporter-associated beta strand protein